ncbi:hypothetical protein B0E52_11590 [Rhodanobacter sp. C06]|uniref:phospholipase effector Tle1 domain-containing protein n=1 Tax=Rhodanobacter sp. C06 TaxID=1945854 RepID=UPI00098647D1|nr:DUF2235 domain-containing protein [Rhodanobacter sp. C06]OOG40439.1 hypothetical protein B0E52_11590 [Rhodanobacter sp. C06]
MSPHDKVDADGVQDDGVPFKAATSNLPIYAEARQRLVSFQEPVLLHADNPHERLFIAALDGTGNDMILDPEHITNVGKFVEQLKAGDDPKVGFGYVPGPGTQQHAFFARVRDNMTGYTVDERAEEMYKQFIDQAKQWLRDDPHAQIRVVGIGFSRGAEEVALFTRIVEERGIQDPSGAHYTYDSHHRITHIEYTKPALVGAHEVAQAVALFDPVGTGHAMHEDRRLPPSVISGIQFIALDEHRRLFKSDHIIDPGITPDGRFAGVYVPGAHSDVGGGYHRDGLSTRTGNFVIDYVNGLSDRPIVEKSPEPDDPRLDVIHDSRKGMWLYRLMPGVDRLAPNGYVELEVPRGEKNRVPDPYNAEPRNEALSRQFERQPMPDAPVPGALAQQPDAPKSEFDQWLDRLHVAAQNPDNGAWDRMRHEAAQAYMCTPGGQLFQQQANELNHTWDLQQAALQAQQQALQQQAQQPSQGFCH